MTLLIKYGIINNVQIIYPQLKKDLFFFEDINFKGGKNMDVLTDMIMTEIKKQYKSVRKFSQAIDIPQTTLASALKNGVSGTAYETIVKICKALNIQLVNYQFPLHIDDNALKLLDIYNKLDEKGKHTVHTVLKMEYDRCSADLSEYQINSFSLNKNTQ